MFYSICFAAKCVNKFFLIIYDLSCSRMMINSANVRKHQWSINYSFEKKMHFGFVMAANNAFSINMEECKFVAQCPGCCFFFICFPNSSLPIIFLMRQRQLRGSYISLTFLSRCFLLSCNHFVSLTIKHFVFYSAWRSTGHFISSPSQTYHYIVRMVNAAAVNEWF